MNDKFFNKGFLAPGRNPYSFIRVSVRPSAVLFLVGVRGSDGRVKVGRGVEEMWRGEVRGNDG